MILSFMPIYYGIVQTIKSFFSNNVQGVWYEPSDLTTIFQDPAGTILPVMEQPVGLMLDKSQGMVLGLEVLTNADFTGGATGWISNAGTSCTFSAGSVSYLTVGSGQGVYQSGVASAGKLYKVSYTCTSYTSGNFSVYVGGSAGIGRNSTGTFTEYVFVAVNSVNTNAGIFCAGGSLSASFDDISVKVVSGNHAIQPNVTNRPILSARVNLLTKTEDFSDATAWSYNVNSIVSTNVNSTIDPIGGNTANKLIANSANNYHWRQQFVSSDMTSKNYTASIYLKSAEYSKGSINIQTISNYAAAALSFDLITKTVISSTSLTGVVVSGSESITELSNGWFKVQFTGRSGANLGNNGLAVYIANNSSAFSFLGDNTSGIYVWGASLVPADQASLPYQRVNTASDYATTGFKTYLKFNGINSSMSTGSVNFTSTDKMTIWAGVRKLSDAAFGLVVELGGDSWGGNSNAFYLGAPENVSIRYSSFSRGNASPLNSMQALFSSSGVSPDTAVLSSTHDISGNLSTIRRNGVAGVDGIGVKGTGNFGNYPLYIGARGGNSYPFNGNLYSLIIRGASTTSQFNVAETYVNSKTGAY